MVPKRSLMSRGGYVILQFVYLALARDVVLRHVRLQIASEIGATTKGLLCLKIEKIPVFF
jgi:hypothetical protein